MIARLRRERRILAALEHPSIARLLDGGTTADGRPWIAMEYIEGLPIDRFCHENHLSTKERCRLIDKVCDAVAYAHRHLVIHRDLKPTNILITADGNPKLLDFGIASLLGGEEGEGEDPLTRGGAAPLTPEYASPEQMRAEPVTTASDVYSLGVVLYQMLTGERPYRVAGTSVPELERVICTTEPKKPSTLETLPGKLRRRLAGDLDNIVLKALHKDVARRYGSAEHLADDIRRHFAGGFPSRPAATRGSTAWSRFLRRNRTAAAAGILVAASVITGAAIDIREAHASGERFDQLRGFARTVLEDLQGQLSDVPGTAKARQTLVTDVDEYLRRVASQHAGDGAALAEEFATTWLRLGEMKGTTPEAVESFENGRRLLERKKDHGALSPADTVVLARLLMREGATLLDLGRAEEGVANLNAAAVLADGILHNRGQGAAWSEAEVVKAFTAWRLGRLYRMQYRLADSEKEARAAIGMCEDALQHGLHTREVEEILTGARNVLAGAERRMGRWPDAMATYQKVLDDTEERARTDPGSAGLQRQMARSHQILGDMVVGLPGHDEEARFNYTCAARSRLRSGWRRSIRGTGQRSSNLPNTFRPGRRLCTALKNRRKGSATCAGPCRFWKRF